MPIPPVSTSSKYRSPTCRTVVTRSRVTPAVGSTMLIRRPASQLNSDDLPTFGRPTIATIGRSIGEFQIPSSRFQARSRLRLVSDSEPATCNLELPKREPTVYHERRAGDVTARVGGEEHCGRAEFVRLTEPAQRDVGLERLPERRPFPEPPAVRVGQEHARG